MLVAILLDEPEHDGFVRFITHNRPAHLSAVSLQEAGMIVRSRRGSDGVDALDELVTVLRLEIVPYDRAQARSAIAAFGAYGKGIHPKAKLNIGDCATYALAKTLGLPLLFKGDDFTATDIVVAR